MRAREFAHYDHTATLADPHHPDVIHTVGFPEWNNSPSIAKNRATKRAKVFAERNGLTFIKIEQFR